MISLVIPSARNFFQILPLFSIIIPADQPPAAPPEPPAPDPPVAPPAPEPPAAPPVPKPPTAIPAPLAAAMALNSGRASVETNLYVELTLC